VRTVCLFFDCQKFQAACVRMLTTKLMVRLSLVVALFVLSSPNVSTSAMTVDDQVNPHRRVVWNHLVGKSQDEAVAHISKDNPHLKVIVLPKVRSEHSTFGPGILTPIFALI
jgi:hypothetical protein